MLPVSPQTICWGYYWARAQPALKVHSGDSVQIQTVSGNPNRLIASGLKPEDVQSQLKEISRSADRKITLDVPYAYNGFGPTTGIFQDDDPYQRTKIIPLDRQRVVGEFASGMEVPLKPFFGSMGIAPWIHAGNMDLKELTAGTKLYAAVASRGNSPKLHHDGLQRRLK